VSTIAIRRAPLSDARASAGAYAFAIALWLGVSTLPLGFQNAISIGGIAIYPFEIALAVAVLLTAERGWKIVNRLPSLAFLVGAFTIAFPLALLSRHPFGAILTDGRGMLVLLVTIILTAALVSDPADRQVLTRAVKYLMVFSAAMVAIGSLTGIPLTGRVEDAGLYLASGTLQTSSAVRLLVPTSHLATGVLAASVAAVLFGYCRPRHAAVWLVPAALIAALSFSRNVLLAVAAAILVAAVTSGRKRLVAAIPRLAATAAMLAGLSIVYIIATPTWDASNWFGKLMIGFETRVLGGLSAQMLSMDTSVLYRDREMANGIDAIVNSPIIGHGLGFAYQSGSGPAGTFWRDQAPYYSHNFYLWIGIKFGIIGICLLVLLVSACIQGPYRDNARSILLFGGSSLLAVSAVAPLPLESYTAVILGIALGGCLGLRLRTRPDEHLHRSGELRAYPPFPDRPSPHVAVSSHGRDSI